MDGTFRARGLTLLGSICAVSQTRVRAREVTGAARPQVCDREAVPTVPTGWAEG
jgi:hypothetical protein